MARYFRERLEELLKRGHARFFAKFTWKAEADIEAHRVFDGFMELVNDTGIDHGNGDPIQGFYLKEPGSEKELAFVLFGMFNPGHANGPWGLELFCNRTIFGHNIDARFYHPVETGDLKHVHF